MIPVGSLATDVADTNTGVARQAYNVIVSRDRGGLAHAPHPSLAAASGATALPSTPMGGTSTINSAGLYSVFVGTSTNIYKMSSIYELDASTSVGSGYSLPSGNYWGYERFGDLLHFTNTFNGLLQFDVNLDSAFSATAAGPKARFIFSWANCLFALDCNGDKRLMLNSAIGNSTIWTGKGAGSQSFQNGDELICGGALSDDYAIVLQRNAVNLLVRRSDGALYDVKHMYQGRGCVNPRAFQIADGTAFWIDTDGFWSFSVGGGLKNIGLEKINQTFLTRLATNALDSVEMAIDKVNNRIITRYQRNDVASATIFEDAYAYHYLIDEWAEIKETMAALFSMATPGYTLDGITAALFGSLDGLTISLDSRFWSGGEPRLAAINGNLKFAYFDGANLASISETSSTQLGVSTLISSVTPLTDAANALVSVGTRDAANATIAWKTGVGIKPSGRCPVRARGKLIALRQTVAAGESWTYLRGFDFLEPTTSSAR